jgi:hypothetical protein
MALLVFSNEREREREREREMGIGHEGTVINDIGEKITRTLYF